MTSMPVMSMMLIMVMMFFLDDPHILDACPHGRV